MKEDEFLFVMGHEMGHFALAHHLARDAGGVTGRPVARATSISGSELGLRNVEMLPGSPSNLYHFAGCLGAVFTLGAPAG